jgi:hypothetical protein
MCLGMENVRFTGRKVFGKITSEFISTQGRSPLISNQQTNVGRRLESRANRREMDDIEEQRN